MATVAPAPPSFRLVIPSEDTWPNTAMLQKELAKKYPVKSVRLVMKNPTEPGFPLVVFVKLYLVKEVFGPTLKQMVRDSDNPRTVSRFIDAPCTRRVPRLGEFGVFAVFRV